MPTLTVSGSIFTDLLLQVTGRHMAYKFTSIGKVKLKIKNITIQRTCRKSFVSEYTVQLFCILCVHPEVKSTLL